MIVGFSRGCCVLNQVLCEAGYSRFSKYVFRRVSRLVLLDGGARKEGFPQLCLSERNTRFLRLCLPLSVSIQGTPYFWGDRDVQSADHKGFEVANLECRDTLVENLTCVGVSCQVRFFLDEYLYVLYSPFIHRGTPGEELDKHLAVLNYFDPFL